MFHDVCHAHLQLSVIVIGVLIKMIYDVSNVWLTALKMSKFNIVDRLVQGPRRAYRGTNVGLLLMHGSSFDQMSFLLSPMPRVGASLSWTQTWGAHLTKPGWSKPHTQSNPTNLVIFGHKITVYRFNWGAHTIADEAQIGAGGWLSRFSLCRTQLPGWY